MSTQLPTVAASDAVVRLTPGSRIDGRETFRFLDGDLVGDELADLILVSLFTWRRASDDDELPPGVSREGWFADPEFGSRLWLLSRAKATAQTLVDAKAYAEEALAWLVIDGLAKGVEVIVERPPAGNGVHMSVRLIRPRQTVAVMRYEYLWST